MIKKIFYIIIFLLCILIPDFVLAHSAASGNTASFGACSSSCKSGPCQWCYAPASKGLRFSLYKYKDGNISYYKSVDYSTTSTNVNGRTAMIVPASAGKVAYQSNIKTLNWSNTYYKLEIKNGSSKFKCFFGASCDDFDKEPILKEFDIDDTSPNPDSVKSKINNFFGTNITKSDLQYLYITVEPTLYIYDKNNKTYYGTIYELLNLPGAKNGQSFYGVNQVLYRDYPISIVAANPTTTDKNGFVGNKVKVLNNFVINEFAGEGFDTYANTRKATQRSATSTNGYGIGVFWVGENVKTDCKSVCGSNNRSCASNYCETQSSTDAAKEACVLACDVDKIEPESCGATTLPSSTTTTCSESKKSTKTTCQYYTNSYYKEVCTEETKVKYSNDLPTTLTKEISGFNYSVRTNGKRTCTLTFDKNYYNYKLDVTLNKNKNKIEQKLIDFKKKDDKTTNYNYKFASTDGIKFYVNGTEYQKLTHVENNTSNLDYSSKSGDTVKEYKTTNESLFVLMPWCYSGKNASLIAGCSEQKSYSDYYGFYSNSSEFEVPTKTISIKQDSGLNDTNKCNYYNVEPEIVDEDINCYTVLNGNYVSGRYEGYVDYYIINRGSSNLLSCKLNGSSIDCDDAIERANVQDLHVSTGTAKEIDASVTYKYNGVEITKKCPLKITPKDTTGKKSCLVENPYPTAYDAIRKYCNDNWSNDINGYTSYNDCYNRCTTRKGTCKTTTKCDDEVSIKKYCNKEENLIKDGYKTTEMCINDCSCGKGTNLDYIYRPIAVGGDLEARVYNAFPNREPGYNWYGYESLTMEDKFEEEPIYTIELNPETIKQIKEETNSDISKYVYYDGDLENSYYNSNLIDKYEGTIFTCKGGC